MLVRNRTNDTIQVAIHNSTSILDIVPVGDSYVVLNAGQEHDMRTDADPGYAWIYKGASRKREQGMWKSGATGKGDTLLVKPSGGGYGFVNYTVVKRKWDGIRQEVQASSNAIEPAVEVATIILTSLVTGVAATGAKGALPSGMLLGVGSLLLMALGMASAEEKPDPAPDMAQIEAAMDRIVTEAVDSRSAKNHANRLVEASIVLVDKGITAHSQLLGKSEMGRLFELSAHDYWDFRDAVEDYQKVTGEFWNSLTSLYNDPVSSRYVIPALLAGIASRLQIWRLHDFIRFLDGGRISDEDLEKFMDQIDRAAHGLDAATESLLDKIRQDIEHEGVPIFSPESSELSRILTFKYTGHETLDFVAKAKTSLRELRLMVETDLTAVRAGQPMRFYWKPEWNGAERAQVPSRPGS